LYSCFVFIVSGYGLFATEAHDKDSFLLEYSGELITDARECGALDNNQDYMYYFQIGDREYWLVYSIYVSS